MVSRAWTRTAWVTAACVVIVAFAAAVAVAVARTGDGSPAATERKPTWGTTSAPAPSAGASARPTPHRTAPSPAGTASSAPTKLVALDQIRSWAYQLQDYPGGRLDKLAAGPYQLVVIDLARDADKDYFSHADVAKLRASGKRVLAYFEIGSIEDFRPEYRTLREDDPGLIANEWSEWPGEYFVRYWDQRWWSQVIRPRVDQALEAGFDGVYLDTPLAYEQISLSDAQGRDREALAAGMTALIIKISKYAKARRPGFLIVPQNSPELRHQTGYTGAIDGIGMEELFFEATDERCTQDYCGENLAETRALRRAGKFVLSVDYATKPADVRAACAHYRGEHFAGTVTVLDLDRTSPPCP
jgi:cysteinyl-tRNA synthetase